MEHITFINEEIDKAKKVYVDTKAKFKNFTGLLVLFTIGFLFTGISYAFNKNVDINTFSVVLSVLFIIEFVVFVLYKRAESDFKGNSIFLNFLEILKEKEIKKHFK